MLNRKQDTIMKNEIGTHNKIETNLNGFQVSGTLKPEDSVDRHLGEEVFVLSQQF